MRLGLIGDIHGDLRALETALRHLESRSIPRIVCTGDLIGYGHHADEVVTLIESLGIPTVRGNHDRWAIEKKQVIGVSGWKPARLKDSSWDYLANLPESLTLTIQDRVIAVHHGSPESDMEFVTPYKPLPASVEAFCGGGRADVLVLGHTHIPMIDRSLPGAIVNVGSAHGIPGIQTSYSFGILDLDDLSVRIFDIRMGREIRRDPIYLGDED
jgi:putative phosphoesterase